MLIAEEYLGPVGRGVTSPQLFRASDGLPYVVKLQNNCLGKKVLANEYLAARFGILMGLCFPPSDLIMLNEQVLRHKKIRAAKVLSGPHFASLYLNKATYVERHLLYAAVNKEQMAGVILFDHMFNNLDRTNNYRNLLIRREAEGFRMYAIDNSHLFFNGRWTIDSLNKMAGEVRINHRRSYGILLKHFLCPQHFLPYIEAVRTTQDEELAAILEEMPANWLSGEERTALLQFMSIRRDNIEDIAAKICLLIPNKNRGSNIN